MSAGRSANGRCPLRISRAAPTPASCRPGDTPPRKRRHRYHGVLAPNHKLRSAVTALAIGNIGKQREAVTGGHGGGGHATGGCCDTREKPRSHDTSRIAWAKLMARVGEEFPFACPNCGGDIRLIAFRLLHECETILGLRTRGNLRLLRTSCPRTGADPKDSDASWRTARAATGVARSRPAHRLGRARADARRSGDLSSVARRAARDRHPQPLSGARREASRPRTGNPRDGLRRGEKIAIAAGSERRFGVSGNLLRTPRPLSPRLTSRSSARKPLQKCH